MSLHSLPDELGLANLGMLIAPTAEHGDMLQEPYQDNINTTKWLTICSYSYTSTANNLLFLRRSSGVFGPFDEVHHLSTLRRVNVGACMVRGKKVLCD